MKKIYLIALLLNLIANNLIHAQCPTNISIVGSTSVCNNSSTLYGLSSDFVNGHWSLSGGGIISSPEPNLIMVNWTTSGTHQLTLTPLNIPGCSNPSPITINVTVHASSGSTAPTSITGPQTVCLNTQATYAIPSIIGQSAMWKIVRLGSSVTPTATVSGNQITVSFNSPGLYYLWAAYNNGSCVGSDTSIRITVSSGTNSITMTGSQSYCNNSTATFTAYGDAIDTYNWSLSSGGNIIVSGTKNENATVQWLSQGSHTLQVTGTNTCSTPRNSSRQINIGASILPAPGPISGQSSSCINAPLNFTIQPVNGATSYVWTISPNSGFTISNASTASPTITFSNKGNYVISVAANNGYCSSLTSSMNIVINSSPTQPSVIGPTAVCLGSTYTYSIATSDPTSTYTWGIFDSNTLQPVTASSAEFIGLNTGTSVQVKFNSGTSHLLITTYASNSCGTASPFMPHYVNRFHTPTASPISISGLSQPCLGTYNYYSDNFNFTNLNWSVNSGGSVQFTGNGYISVNWGSPGANSVSITGTNACGATASTSMPITVSSATKPVITFSGPINVCVGETKTYTVLPSTGINYSWNLNNSPIPSSANTATITWNTAGWNNQIRINPSYSQCQLESINQYITVHQVTQPIIQANSTTTFCTGGSVQLANTNTFSGLSYQWRRDGTAIAGATSTTYNANQSGSYALSATNPYNCSAVSLPITVVSNSFPLASISNTSSTTICSGSSVVLSANTGVGLTYQWRLNNSNIPGATNQSYSAIQAGSYTVIVTSNGCSSTSGAVIVTVNSSPAALISTSTATTFCSGGSVVLNANTGTGLTYQWRRDGNAIAGATAASYSANQSGSYTVVVTNTNSCSTTSTPTVVTVNPLPAATITAASSTTFCAGGSVVLNANTGTGLSYQWRKDGNTIAGATAASYTANQSGSYTVVVTNASSCSTTSLPSTVVVNPLPIATVTAAGSTTFCAGAGVVLNANTGSGLTYQWRRDGNAIAGATASSYTANQSGSYTVVVTNTAACSATSTATTVTVNPLPTAAISASTTAFCQGSSVVLNATTSAGYAYQWKLNGTNISGASNSSYTATQGGSYTVFVTANGCSATSAATVVTMNPGPVNNTITSSSTTACVGQSFTISSSGGTGTPYYWASTNAGASWNVFAQQYGGQSSFQYTPTQAGTYRFYVYNHNGCGWCWDTGGCPAPSYVDVVVNPAPVDASITANVSTICLGQSVTISSSGGTGTPYYWASTDGGASWNVFSQQYGGQTSFQYTPTSAGTYRFHVRNQNNCGFCWNTNTCSTYPYVDVVVNPGPVDATISASASSICLGQSVTISSAGGTGSPYYWASTNGGSSWNVFSQQYGGQTSFQYTPTAPGTYRFHVRNQNGCGFCWNTNSCSAGSIVDVVVKPLPSASIGGELSFCTGSGTTLTAYPSGAGYAWSTGSTSQSTYVSSGGYVSVTVNQNGCSASATVYVTEDSCNPDPDPCVPPFCPCFEPVCAREREEAHRKLFAENLHIGIFPNPVNASLSVELSVPALEDLPIRLYSPIGIVSRSTIIGKNKTSATIDTQSLSEGMYVVEVIPGHGLPVSRQKVMIVH
jgi:hypothetical protein